MIQAKVARLKKEEKTSLPQPFRSILSSRCRRKPSPKSEREWTRNAALKGFEASTGRERSRAIVRSSGTVPPSGDGPGEAEQGAGFGAAAAAASEALTEKDFDQASTRRQVERNVKVSSTAVLRKKISSAFRRSTILLVKIFQRSS